VRGGIESRQKILYRLWNTGINVLKIKEVKSNG